LLATAAICAVMALPHPAAAQSPTGGNVVAGTAGIAQAGAVTNINQSSQKAIINWQGFSVGAQNTVNFNQPNSSSATLNRVIGNEQSVINGAINANGQVFIVNSAGVLFGKGAQVNVGGLVASTLDIANSDFMAGNYKFSGTSNASVVNQGRIRARGDGQGGGYVALLGKAVSNEGVISAKLGTVAMASGEKITLNFGGDSLLDVTIDKGTLNALVQNKRAIIANGGQVIMTAKVADQVLSAQVNNTGIIQARTMAALKGGSNGGTVKIGKIKLLAQGGTTNVSGKLDASAPNGGDGGFIETSGDHVNIADSAVITTLAASGNSGTWLIDPYNITISSGPTSNGGFNNGSPNTYTPTGTSVVNVAMLQAALANGNVVITTGLAGSPGADAGDINVNAAVIWSASTTLTLTAAHDININQSITATGASGGLVFTAANNINVNNAVKLDGANATLAMTYGGSYNIRTPASYSGAVTGPVYDRDGKPVYELVSVQKVNPPLDNTNGSKATYGGPTPGPVYDADGNPVYEQVQGNQVTGLVGQQDTSGGVYGSITFSNSANTFGTNPNGLTINGQVYHLVHSMNDLVSAVNTTPGGFYALGNNLDPTTDAGSTYTFGGAPISTLTGALHGLGHTITGLTINDTAGTGGDALVGTLGSNTIAGASIRDIGLVNAAITDIRQAPANIGSLVAVNWGAIGNSYARNVLITANNSNSSTGVGGLVGANNVTGIITGSFATGSVTVPSTSRIANAFGGLVGYNAGKISNSHAGTPGIVMVKVTSTGNSGQANILGGLVGNNVATGKIDLSYSDGDVSVTNGMNIGGLVGSNTGTISNSHSTGDVTLAATLNGGSTVGGLVGAQGSATALIFNSYATGDVTVTADLSNVSSSNIGGLVGQSATGSTIDTAFASGKVTANDSITVGGLVGNLATAAKIFNSSFSGDVSGKFIVGGLVGTAAVGTLIDSSHAGPGTVTAVSTTGNGYAGGLVGQLNGATLKNSTTSLDVFGGTGAGGIAGSIVQGGIIDSSSASGNVRMTGTSATGWAGGIAGSMTTGTIKNSSSTGDVSGFNNVGGVVGQTFSGQSSILSDDHGFGSISCTGTRCGGTIGNPLGTSTVTNVTQVDAKALALVAAQAAAAEAAAQAAAAAAALQAQGEQGARTANAVTNNAQNSSVTPPDPALANAGASAAQSVQSAAIEESVKSVDDAVKADDKRAKEERERERRRTAQSSHRSQGSKPGSGLGATIRSIDVNGQRFNLENNAPKQDAPTQAPH
jgi:filamentous hemagglutinin family protein